MVGRVNDALQGYAINGISGARKNVAGYLVNMAAGHALGLYSSKGAGPTFKDGVEIYEDKRGIFSGGQAITLGNVITGHGSSLKDVNIYNHELGHAYNQSSLGVYYIPSHALSMGMGNLTTPFWGHPRDNPLYFLEQSPFKGIPYSELYR